MIEYIWRINGFDVFYTNETNGGGDYFAIEYIDLVKEWYVKVDSILEWCAGPGFIGYGMFANNLCNKISFNDKFKSAIDQLEKTKLNSKNPDDIKIYNGGSLSTIPETEKCDLIVGNPPHWKDIQSAETSLNLQFKSFKHVNDILVDTDWKSHTLFYQIAKKLLSDKGKIVLQENLKGSTPKTFERMINDSGLKILSYADSKMYNDIYYIEVSHK